MSFCALLLETCIAVDKSREKGERGMEKTVIKHT